MPDSRFLPPAAPEWLPAFTLRATAKAPPAHYPDAARSVAPPEGQAPGTAVTPRMSPLVDADQDTAQRRRPRRRRWAAAALALVVMLAAGALGAFLLLPGDGGGPPPVATVPLTISAVRDYDPQGNDEAENAVQRGYSVDADPTTAWYTERYHSTEFGGLKSGVGLVLRLTEPAVATEMIVSTPTPGARFQVLGPLDAGNREVLATGTLTGTDQVIPLTTAVPSQVYVLWITSLVSDGEGGYWAGVGQVQLGGVPNST